MRLVPLLLCCWIVMYLMDSAIHLLNNWGLITHYPLDDVIFGFSNSYSLDSKLSSEYCYPPGPGCSIVEWCYPLDKSLSSRKVLCKSITLMFRQLGPVPQLGRGLLNRGSQVQYLGSDQYSGSTRGQSYCLPL